MENKRYYALAFGLAVFTIFYNLAEGLISIFFGYTDESITLFGFGIDSFIETISGIGILHMIARIRINPTSNRDEYERTALKVTGFSFYVLVIGLCISGAYTLLKGHEPETTFYGLIIAVLSIAIMLVLVHYKTKAGKALKSEAILADAECTKVCIYMSVVLLLSSAIYYLFQFPYTDGIGAFILAYFSFKEGKECFEKAASEKYCSCDHS